MHAATYTAIRTWIHTSTDPGHHGLDYRARLGPVKALAMLDPLRGLAALTDEEVAVIRCHAETMAFIVVEMYLDHHVPSQ